MPLVTAPLLARLPMRTANRNLPSRRLGDPVAKERGLGFTGPVPARAIVDPRLSSPSMLRLLALYAWHDRRSLSRDPPGVGCTASNKLLSARIGCDYTTVLKLRVRLEELGYVEVETHDNATGKRYRLEVVRVIPDHLADPAKWPFDPAYIGPDCQKVWNRNHGEVAMKSDPSGGQNHGEAAMNGGAKHGDPAMSADENHGDEFSETRRKPPKTDDQYIPLSGETYSVETGETYSVETAHSNGDAVGGKLARLERRSKADPSSITDADIAWLEAIVLAHADDPNQVSRWAFRLLEAIDPDDLREDGE